MKTIPCPNCYGGHFKPCQTCGDSGIIELMDPTPTPYDSTADTQKHILRVRELLFIAINNLEKRAYAHDQSKLGPVEKPIFDAVTPKLRGLTYGSEEYKASLAEMKPALDHHYAHNPHHPEFAFAAEEWRDVVGYEGSYQVSNLGRVRSVKRVVERDGTQGSLTVNELIRKGHITPKGYVRVQLTTGGAPKSFMVHSLVAEAFHGPPPSEQHQVNHKSGMKSDNRAVNLEWVTPSQNLQDAYDNELRQPNVKCVYHCESLGIFTLGGAKMAAECVKAGHLGVTPAGVWNSAMRGGCHQGLTFTASPIEHDIERSGVNDMSLLDVIELLCDWKAAGERHADGSMVRSLEVNKKRFGISDQLQDILANTAREMKWI